MITLRAKKRVQSYKSFGRYIRAVYNNNKGLIDERIIAPSGKTKYEVFRDQAKEWFKYGFKEEFQNAAISKNPRMAAKGIWNKIVDKMARSTLITPHGKGYEEQILDEFWSQATKGEKAKFTRKKRQKTQDKTAKVTTEDMEYLGYDDEYSYFQFDDETLVKVDKDPSPKGPNWKKYSIITDQKEVNQTVRDLKQHQFDKIQKRNMARLSGDVYGSTQR